VIRAIWFLLVALSTAFAQVQPVDVRLVPEESCDCCDQPGSCGLPDCGLPPIAADSRAPVQITTVIVAKRAVMAPRVAGGDFHAQFQSRARIASARLMGNAAASVVSAPRYRVYCSFLI